MCIWQGRWAGAARLGEVVALLATVLLLACRSGTEPEAASPKVVRDNRIVHEPCDPAGSTQSQADSNGDGRADVGVVRVAGREHCRWLDFNFDGRVDLWIYSAANGQQRRRESDFDRDGSIDEIAIYAGAQPLEKWRATNQSGKLDTWHFFQGGRLVRSERDSNLDGVIDQWWEYPRPKRLDCPLIHADLNGDGRPDPGASVDLCTQGRTP